MNFSELENIARGLGKAQRIGKSFSVQCPAHEDHNPSLSLSLGDDGKLLAYCHADCSFENILYGIREKGLLPVREEEYSYSPRIDKTEVKKEANNNIINAKDLWSEAQTVKGTLGEVYLQSRLKNLLTEIPPTLKFLQNLKHAPSGKDFPCLLAAVAHYPEQTVTAVLRIYLAPDGQGKAPVANPKMMLGKCSGGAIRLAPVTEELILCEGLEDGLTLMAALKKPVWVAGSASMLETIKLPDLPLARTVYLAQDNDEAGERAMQKLGSRLQAEGREIRILKPPHPYKDFNEILQDQTLNTPKNTQQNHQEEEIKMNSNTKSIQIIENCLVESKKFISEIEAEEPLPLRTPLAEAADYPVDALGDIAENAVRGIADTVQCSPALSAQSILSTMSMVTQTFINVVLPQGSGQPVPTSLYFVSIARSGDRKSSSDREAMRAVKEFEEELNKKASINQEKYRNEKEVYEANKKKIMTDKDIKSEAKPQLLNDLLLSKPQEPIPPVLQAQEPTLEGMHKYYEKGSCSLALMSSEGGQFLGGYAMNQDNRIKTAAGLSTIWDGEPIKRMRGGDGTSSLYNKRLSIHLMVQPGIYENLLSDESLKDQGLLSRLLCSYPPSLIGTRLSKEPLPRSSPDIQTFNNRIRELLDKMAKNGELLEIEHKNIPLTPEAKKAFFDFTDECERKMANGGEYESITGLGSKLPELAARIASVIAFFENTDENPEMRELEGGYYKRGMILARYHAGEALRLFGNAAASPELLQAERLLEALLKWPEEYISLVEIYQGAYAGIRDKKQAAKIMKILCDHKWVIPETKKQIIKGVPRVNSYKLRKKYINETYFRQILDSFRLTLDNSESIKKEASNPQNTKDFEALSPVTLDTLDTLDKGKNLIFIKDGKKYELTEGGSL